MTDIVDFRATIPGLTFLRGDSCRDEAVLVGLELIAFTDGEAKTVLDPLLIDPFDNGLAVVGLGPVRPLRTVLVTDRARPSSAPRIDAVFEAWPTVERGLLSVAVEETRGNGLDEVFKIDLTGDVDPALSGGIGGLFSASSSFPLNASFRCPTALLMELTEFRGLRPTVKPFDAVVVACGRRPSVLDRGREEAFERLPFGVFRAEDDTVGLEAAGGVALVFLSVAATVRAGGMPFFGDGLCTPSLALSGFLPTVLLLGASSDAFMMPPVGPFAGDSAFLCDLGH